MEENPSMQVLGVIKDNKKTDKEDTGDKEKDNVVDAEVVDGKEDKEKRA